MASDGRSRLDGDDYRDRNVVERYFGRLKEYRRIATRYDKTARNYLAMVTLGCIRLFYQRPRSLSPDELHKCHISELFA